VVDTIQKLRALKVNAQVVDMEGVVIEAGVKYVIRVTGGV
jgi:hypothetical protein